MTRKDNIRLLKFLLSDLKKKRIYYNEDSIIFLINKMEDDACRVWRERITYYDTLMISVFGLNIRISTSPNRHTMSGIEERSNCYVVYNGECLGEEDLYDIVLKMLLHSVHS